MPKRNKWGTSLSLLFVLCLIVVVRCPVLRAQDNSFSCDRQLSDLIETIKPGIVAVGTYYFNDIPKVRYLGTGFVLKRSKRIVTNFHVVSGVIEDKKQAHLKIFQKAFPSKGKSVRIVAKDEYHDLAILETTPKEILPGLSISDDPVKEGYHVVFIGYPIGLVLGVNPTTHTGIISAIAPIILPSPSARIIDGDLIRHLKAPYDVYQIDGTAYPGNSGSPVCLQRTGEVIGVINKVFVKDKKEHALEHPSGITYAIPSGFIRELEKMIPESD